MITRRVHKSIDHVWSRDPALDKSNEAEFAKAWEAFKKGGDVGLLPIREGQRPTVFRCVSLKRLHMLTLSDTAMLELKGLVRSGGDGIVALAFLRVCDEVVARGVIGADNFCDEQGRQVSLTFVDDGRGGKLLSKDSLEDLHHVSLVNELGFRILEISMPDPTSGQA